MKNLKILRTFLLLIPTAAYLLCIGSTLIACISWGSTKTENVMQQSALAAQTAAWLIAGYCLARCVEKICGSLYRATELWQDQVISRIGERERLSFAKVLP